MANIDFTIYRRNTFCLIFWAVIVVSPARSHSDIELQIKSLDEQILTESNNGQLYLKRAELHRQHLSWGEALADYENAEKHGVANYVLYFYRGRLYQESNQENKALQNLSAAIESNPAHAQAYIERSKIPSRPILEAVSDLDSAISLLQKPSPDLYLNRAQLLAAAGPEHFEHMMSGLQDGINQLGSIVSLIEFAVTNSMSQEKWITAQKQIEQLPTILRQSPKWLYIEGQNQSHLNNTSHSKELYQQALDKIEKLPNARANSSAIQRLKKEIQAAFR